MALPAGKLVHQLLIERRVTGRDSFGGQSEAWEAVATVRAWPIFGKGSERREAAQTAATLSATFRVRRSAVTEAIDPGQHRLRCDPIIRVPANLAAAAVWNIAGVVAADQDAIDVDATTSLNVAA